MEKQKAGKDCYHFRIRFYRVRCLYDPGNFATNIATGSQYGYLLLWVILASNLMAVLIQTLSAKLGIATGNNLPEIARENFPKPVSIGLWIQGELVIMATDLAEFIEPLWGFTYYLES